MAKKNQARSVIAKRTRRRFHMPFSSILMALLYKFLAKTITPPQASSTKIKYLHLSKNAFKINAQVKVWKAFILFMTMRPPINVKLHCLFFTTRKGYSAWWPSVFSWPKSLWSSVYFHCERNCLQVKPMPIEVPLGRRIFSVSTVYQRETSLQNLSHG